MNPADTRTPLPVAWEETVEICAFEKKDDRCFIVDDDVDLSFVKDAREPVREMRATAPAQTTVAKRVR